MKKPFMIVLILLLSAGGILFYDQVVQIFHGMTALDAMRFILNFVLHVAVVTILSYMAYNLPELLKPWMKSLRWKRRGLRRGRTQQGTSPRVKTPKLTNAQLIHLLMSQQGNGRKRPTEPTANPQGDLPLDF